MTSQHSSELEDIREHFERYRGVTLQTLDLVPDEKLSWRPGEGLRSFAGQFLHIAQTEDYYVRGLFETDPTGVVQSPPRSARWARSNPRRGRRASLAAL